MISRTTWMLGALLLAAGCGGGGGASDGGSDGGGGCTIAGNLVVNAGFECGGDAPTEWSPIYGTLEFPSGDAKSGQRAAETLIDVLPDTSAAALQQYDRTWWREYKTMYRFLRWLQKWGYGNERQMEVFTDMCRNKDVQQLTFESYMFKRMTPVPWLSQMRMTGDILASQVRHYLPYAGARA